MDSRLRGNDEWKGSLAHAKVVKAHPGSESGTCFRTNRSSRLAPAHQGVKSWSCGLIRRIGTADSATPLLRPSGGQAPALHFLIPPSPIGLRLGRIRRWRVGIEVDWRAVAFGQSRGHVTSFSYQSLIPVATGTPRYENWHRPHPSGFRRRIGVRGCFRRKDEVGSPCGRRWSYRSWRSFAGC